MLRKWWLIFAQACTVALAALFVLQTLKPQWLRRWVDAPPAAAPVALAPAPAASGVAPAAAPGSLAAAAARAAPAVVSIATTGARGTSAWGREPPWGDPERRGVGSGVIVDAAGYVLTNHHVIRGARSIEVQLSDGRQTEAELVGADPETDLALLKLPADKLGRLRVIELGSSRQLQVGDPVLAIGNPFGVGQTVTAGIVSALQRQQLGINVFESFIQTDAPINPGNSGGALVDGQGRLVGINSAIYSKSGGSMGLGFSIPVEMASEVMQALRTDGQVARGYMGVTTRELGPELIEALRLPPDIQGVLVNGVVQGEPAAQAGVRPGDVITRVGDSPVRSPDALLLAVAQLKPGTEVMLHLQRGREALELRARVGKRPPPRNP